MVITRRAIIYIAAIDLFLLAIAVSVLVFRGGGPVPLGLEGFGSGRMRLSSPAFSQNGPVPARHTCDGGDVIPPLEISGVPDGAKSLALVVDDPDAPIGAWTHWTLWNVAPAVARIEEGKVPGDAAQGVTSYGAPGYRGPCPPYGTHRYFFKLYALDAVLTLPSSTDARALQAAMEPHVIDSAGLVGTYRRK